MPADIRSFFGGGGRASQQSEAKEEQKPKQARKASRKSTRVIEDSDDDEEVKPKKATPRKPAPKKAQREPSPKRVETTTSAFFSSSNKPKRSEPVKAKRESTPKDTPKATPKGTPKGTPKRTPKATPAKANSKASQTATPASKGKTPGRVKKPVTYAEHDDGDEFLDDDLDETEDIFGENFKKASRNGRDDYVHEDYDDDLPIALPRRSTPRGKKQKTLKEEDDFDPEEEDIDMKDVDNEEDFVEPDEEEQAVKSKPKKSSIAGRKRKSPEPDLDEEEEEEVKPKKGRPKKSDDTKKSPAKKKAKKTDEVEDAGAQAIYDSIPLVRPPTPPPKEEGAKFDWRANAGRSEALPTSGGSLEMPEGSPTCLAGLTFVFTGVGQYWGRTEAQDLVKRHGGKVTGSPSSKTSFVVLGTDAGPSKLRKIKEMGIKTIDEEGLVQLITKLSNRGDASNSKAQEAYNKQQEAEEKKIREQAAEIEKEERRLGGAGGAGTSKASSTANKSTEPPVDSRLWTTKYAPTSLGQICGNKTAVEKLQRWLQRFPKMVKTGFKLPGPDASGTFRAVMLHGPPGIGKTTAAHLVAKLEGYDIVESNASDTRSKKLVEDGLRGVLSTTSLNGYFYRGEQKVEASKKKLVLIMDEVDGMSAGDRGGVGALAAVCKKTEVPMILICNDRRLPKMKPFDYVTFDIPFRRPTVDQIRSRIMTIAFREGLKMPPPVVNALIEGSHADIRQVVNMVSTAKLDQAAMDFDKGKEMSKAWQKHVILKPWDLTAKILGGGMFAESSKATLNDKIELYFNDHEFSPLMLQENYLGTNPIRSLSYGGREKNLKHLELAEKAAESISDGDLVDRMIHGSQQHWSLMPTHAVFSFVRPASYVSGSLAGHQMRFTSWLGKNSNQQKLTRMVKEIQAHMRLRSSGDRHEVRQQYIPVLWTEMIKKLETKGKGAVPEVIELMDSYFLTKEDFDAIMELGVGYMDQEKVKLETQAKSTFTRLYNQQTHPVPFMKASNVIASKKAAKEKPDLEEAIEESDEEEVVEEAKDDDAETDLTKDKYVKQPKKKGAAKKAQKAKAKRNDDDESEEEKPKRGKGNAAAGRGRGRGRK